MCLQRKVGIGIGATLFVVGGVALYRYWVRKPSGSAAADADAQGGVPSAIPAGSTFLCDVFIDGRRGLATMALVNVGGKSVLTVSKITDMGMPTREWGLYQRVKEVTPTLDASTQCDAGITGNATAPPSPMPVVDPAPHHVHMVGSLVTHAHNEQTLAVALDEIGHRSMISLVDEMSPPGSPTLMNVQVDAPFVDTTHIEMPSEEETEQTVPSSLIQVPPLPRPEASQYSNGTIEAASTTPAPIVFESQVGGSPVTPVQSEATSNVPPVGVKEATVTAPVEDTTAPNSPVPIVVQVHAAIVHADHVEMASEVQSEQSVSPRPIQMPPLPSGASQDASGIIDDATAPASPVHIDVQVGTVTPITVHDEVATEKETYVPAIHTAAPSPILSPAQPTDSPTSAPTPLPENLTPAPQPTSAPVLVKETNTQSDVQEETRVDTTVPTLAPGEVPLDAEVDAVPDVPPLHGNVIVPETPIVPEPMNEVVGEGVPDIVPVHVEDAALVVPAVHITHTGLKPALMPITYKVLKALKTFWTPEMEAEYLRQKKAVPTIPPSLVLDVITVRTLAISGDALNVESWQAWLKAQGKGYTRPTDANHQFRTFVRESGPAVLVGGTAAEG